MIELDGYISIRWMNVVFLKYDNFDIIEYKSIRHTPPIMIYGKN